MNRLLLVCASVLLVAVCGNTTFARPQYKKEFDEKYKDLPPEVQAAIKTAACNVCHVKDKPKTQRNSYGEVLRDELGKAGFNGPAVKAALAPNGPRADLLKALGKAMDEAEKAKDADGKPYGEQIKAGHLPK